MKSELNLSRVYGEVSPTNIILGVHRVEKLLVKQVLRLGFITPLA